MLNISSLMKAVQEQPKIELRQHPRLYIDAAAIERLRSVSEMPMLKAAQKYLEETAPVYTKSTEFDFNVAGHNSYLIRARIMQTRTITLLARWLQTGEEEYRASVLRNVEAIDAWPIWSWIDWFETSTPDTEADFVTFDLSYGENCLTLAVAYDLLFDTLQDCEKQLFYDCIRHHKVFETFIRCVEDPDFKDRKGRAGWFLQNEKCNWLTVLCGGMGTLALSMYDDFPEAHKALFYCDAGVQTLMKFASDCNGSWPEGLSYFCYTLRYAIVYLDSWEKATGTVNPSYEYPGIKSIIPYFLDLLPNGVPCTFGDNNNPWEPMGFHYQICRRLSQQGLFKLVSSQYVETQTELESWPNSVERLLFAPRDEEASSAETEEQAIHFYPGSNVTVMADRLPDPSIEMVIRGGNSRGNHEHNDLSSFHLVLGNESMITSLSTDDYMDTTFSGRREEIFEMTPQAKNVLLVNGVGMQMRSDVSQTEVEIDGLRGIHMDCTKALGVQRQNMPTASSYFRTYLMIDDLAYLVIDDCTVCHAARLETRFHTYADVETAQSSAVLCANGTAKKACLHVKKPVQPICQKLYVSFAANRDCVLMTGVDMPTYPKTPSTALRWITKKFEMDIRTAALFSRVEGSSVEVKENFLNITIGEKQYQLQM